MPLSGQSQILTAHTRKPRWWYGAHLPTTCVIQHIKSDAAHKYTREPAVKIFSVEEGLKCAQDFPQVGQTHLECAI